MEWTRTGARAVAAAAVAVMMGVMGMMGPIGMATTGAFAGTEPGVEVEPGLWEFTSSLADPLGGGVVPQTHRTCVREGTITPEVVMKRVRECRIYEASVQATMARWKMKCATAAGPMTGSGLLHSAGSEVSGSLQMTFTVGSLQVPTSSSFKGRRVGRCG